MSSHERVQLPNPGGARGGASSGDQDLGHYLTIGSPSPTENVSTSIEFSRFRDVEIRWDRVLDDALDEDGGSTNGDRDALRLFVEGSVPITEQDFERRKQEVLSSDPPYWVDGTEPEAPGDEEFNQWEASPRLRHLDNTLCFIGKHAEGTRRVYLPLDVEGEVITDAKAETFHGYEALWERTYGLQLVFNTEQDALDGVSEVEFIDNAASRILREWRDLDTEEAFADSMGRLADDLLEAIHKSSGNEPPSEMAGDGSEWLREIWASPEQVERVFRRYRALKLTSGRVREAKERLADHAADLGYLLPLAETKIKFPNGEEKTLEPGTLYVRERREIRWTTKHRVSKTKTVAAGCGGTARVRYHEVVQRHHVDSVTDYSPVPVDHDPWVERIRDLRKKFVYTHVFTRDGSGYVSSEGVSLEDVVRRCDGSESYRRHCVVLIPQYEISFRGEEVFFGYLIFKRPLPAVVADRYPTITVFEELAYRRTWLGIELGELISSISLAPGETRQVLANRSRTDTKRSSRTRTSLSEFRGEETSGFEREMEREAMRDMRKKSGSQAGVSAGGSYGPFNASARASASRSRSLRVFRKSVSRMARRAASSLSRVAREETVISDERSSETSQSTSTTLNLSNINEGQTLNLFFYLVNNRYRGSLYLDGLSFQVVGGRELISGSGIYPTLNASDGDLDHILPLLAPDQLPVRPSGALKYWEHLILQVGETLRSEYGELECVDDGQSPALALDADAVWTVVDDWQEAAPRPEAVWDRYEELKELLDALDLTGKPLSCDHFLVPSEGLYVDSVLGRRSAVETYSEAMRQARVRREMAEIAVLAKDAGGGNEVRDARPVDGALHISTLRTLQPGSWAVVLVEDDLDVRPLGRVVVGPDGAREISVPYDGDDDDGLVDSIEIRLEGGDRVVRSPRFFDR